MNQSLPIYLQISQYIEDEILNHQLQAHDKVPSTNEFSKIMKINPATAGKGLNELVDSGILYKKRGLGMFVTEEAESIIIEQRRRTFKKYTLPALIRDAALLKLSKEELIELIRGEFHD
ncbi:GntR family transcriptional regulator [Allofustis seminis]|uniref:GntR family transcriptional regulator n=1 Tax=Allofustis seminis TaxID=166939 RepID=UPI0003654CC8|nr:GntR family transcriptional regulator [Allofustis seminis]